MTRGGRVIAAGLGVVAALGVFVSGAGWAEELSFEAVKARYLSLRNTDTELSREPEWRAVAKDFESFAAAHPRDRSAPRALLNASIVHTEIFHKTRDRSELSQALANLERLEGEHPEDLLADDAAVQRGDLYLRELGDRERAEEVYAEVVERFPSGDMLGVAQQRLREMAHEGGEKDAAKPRSVEGAASSGGAVIVLDPGHGGEDFGAEGPGGLLEKDVTLAVAREVERLLKSELGVRVRLTRTDDSFLPLLQRTAFANNVDAALFVSIHVNASPGQNVSGVEAYYLDTTDGESARTLAERENSSVRFEGAAGDLAYMLSDLVQSAKTGDSMRLARLLEQSIVSRLASAWPDVKGLGVKKALFYVLVGAHMPCALVELGFMDHPVEGKRIADEAYRREAARGIVDGIRIYLKNPA